MATAMPQKDNKRIDGKQVSNKQAYDQI